MLRNEKLKMGASKVSARFRSLLKLTDDAMMVEVMAEVLFGLLETRRRWTGDDGRQQAQARSGIGRSTRRDSADVGSNNFRRQKLSMTQGS